MGRGLLLSLLASVAMLAPVAVQASSADAQSQGIKWDERQGELEQQGKGTDVT